jgi:hypothetical protein
MTEQTQKIYDAWGQEWLKQKKFYEKPSLAAAFRELINQYGYNNFNIDGDHGLDVVNVRDILKVIEELEND